MTHNIKHQTAAALVVAAENKGKKRPPTPPRKPKIDRNNFPGLQFIGKENFGNAVIPSPTPPSAPGTPSSELDAPACLPIITGAASEVVAIKPAPTKPMIPAAHAVIVPEEPAYAVRLLSEIERGSCHSPTSEVQSTHRTENGNRFVAKSEDEEELDDASVNGDLSLHGVTDAVSRCVLRLLGMNEKKDVWLPPAKREGNGDRRLPRARKPRCSGDMRINATLARLVPSSPLNLLFIPFPSLISAFAALRI